MAIVRVSGAGSSHCIPIPKPLADTRPTSRAQSERSNKRKQKLIGGDPSRRSRAKPEMGRANAHRNECASLPLRNAPSKSSPPPPLSGGAHTRRNYHSDVKCWFCVFVRRFCCVLLLLFSAPLALPLLSLSVCYVWSGWRVPAAAAVAAHTVARQTGSAAASKTAFKRMFYSTM